MTRIAPSLLLGLALAAATLGAFAGVGGLGIVFDDWQYVYENPVVSRGLSAAALRWAFTTTHAANWHPVTWISHLLDVTLFGLAPAGPHLVNLAFHVANTLLLFGLLRAWGGGLWPAVLAAAFFAVHPLRVESVAWVAERKDVLSTFFGMLALAAYDRYVRAPGVRRGALVALAFAVGLMAKPMLVTLPFVLLLLDWWPYGRIAAFRGPAAPDVQRRAPDLPSLGVVAEKLPLMLLAAAAAGATLHAQGSATAIIEFSALPLGDRLANAVCAWVSYLGLIFWPRGLAVLYPYQTGLPLARVALSTVVLLAMTAAFIRARRRFPPLAVGWFWYLGTLVPVIGIVQVGGQSMADRYTYVPQVGVAVAVVWTLGSALRSRRALRAGALACSLVVLGILAAQTHRQVSFWKDEESLFGHSLAVGGPSALAHSNLGVAMLNLGRPAEAEQHFRQALAIKSFDTVAELKLGELLAARGEKAEAERLFRAAISQDPLFADPYVALAELLLARGDSRGAVAMLEEAARLRPSDGSIRSQLAQALWSDGRLEAAAALYRELTVTEFDKAAAHLNYGVSLASLGRRAEAEREIRESLRLEPGNPAAHRNLAILLEQTGRRGEALAEYRAALRLDPGDAAVRARVQDLDREVPPGDSPRP